MEPRSQSFKKELISISRKYDIRLNKKAGQCVLIDKNIANYIITKAELTIKDIVYEIGPGFGFLTEQIIPKVANIIIIEKDVKLSNYLTEKFSKDLNIEVVSGDALKFEFPEHTKLISNVPYHISGPLIQKIILSKQKKASKIILMLQQEFIDRMRSEPKPKNYGRLSVISSLFFDIQYLKKIPPTVFYPRPSVQSGIIEIKPKEQKNIPAILIDFSNRTAFFEFLSGIFPYKNKLISKSLSIFFKNLKRGSTSFSEIAMLRFSAGQARFESDKSVSLKNASNRRLWSLKPEEIVSIFSELFFR
jgi:16S rRNA (adenine1518-N6/adenine1519-N6)-dimethyltransferase